MTITTNYLSASKAAALLNCSAANVRLLGSRGTFPGRVNVGSEEQPFWLFPAAEVEAYRRKKKHAGGRPKGKS